MNVSRAAMLAGILGWPVSQSLSPRMHSYWLDNLGLNGAYIPLPVRPEDFSLVISALMKSGFSGANVTLPHKEAAFALAHECDRAAQICGAANLLIFHGDGRIEARNSDATGLAEALREHFGGALLRGKAAVILGAGGAARAAVLALNELGAAEVRVVNRSRTRAEQLAAALAPTQKVQVFAQSDWRLAAKDVALVVHATSAGMKEAPSLDLALDPLPKTTWICDIVYNPLETGLLKRAKQAGFKTIDGLGMLMHQAVPAFEAFFGATPKVTPALRRYLEEALGSGN